ncbi:methyl-accepting chemotaxis protein [Bradyrhizobium sp. Cp5.3]|uniref:methyl-accepting chemotaxis protein n=1 Tax=Bradyrhizobium sp. Cp5.3 TaxID=443598 RepID=UPI0018DCA168|nr:HAMP domain-containing methyl-accepting chemotaxis protein [Bradyrhizobium sp. Cp5.3]
MLLSTAEMPNEKSAPSEEITVSQARFRSVVGFVRSSLMYRVLLPIATLLTVMIAGAVVAIAVNDIDTARSALSSKTRLVANIAGRGTADAIWNLDAQLARASLAALAADPDYVGSELSDDHGKVLATDGVSVVTTGSIIVEKVPVIRMDQGQQKMIGALELRMSTARADAAIAHDILAIISAGLFGLIVVCGLLFWFLKNATRPIEALTHAMANLSSGKLDAEIPALDRLDEVGRMAQAVEIFKRNAIEVERLNAERATIKAQSEQDRIELLDRMARQFETTVSAVLTSVVRSCGNMGQQAEGLAGKMSAAESSTQKIRLATNTTSDSVQTVAAAAEELSVSISEISNRVKDSASITVDTSNAAEMASGTISELSEQVQKIGSSISLIHNVASQTDLLALNATIEAARAGDAGKGFAIVASEVKSLATQTARATDEISANIQAIQAATARAVAEIRTIAAIAAQSREIATGIAGAIEQQSAATREISVSVSRAASGTHVVAENVATVSESFTDASQATRDLLSASRELGDEFRTLEDQVQEFVATVRGAR